MAPEVFAGEFYSFEVRSPALTLQMHALPCTFFPHTPLASLLSTVLHAHRSHCTQVDFWAMGVMLHEILTGFTIGSYKAPSIASDLLEPAASALIHQLLTPVREVRLGCGSGGAGAIREHAFFEGLDWAKVAAKDGPAPLNLKRLTMDHSGEDSGEGHSGQGPPERGTPSRMFGQGADLMPSSPMRELRCDASQTTCSSGSSAHAGSERSLSDK